MKKKKANVIKENISMPTIVNKTNLPTKTVGLIIAGVVLAVALAFSCVATVPTGHTGVVTTFGRVADYTYDAGVHLKLP